MKYSYVAVSIVSGLLTVASVTVVAESASVYAGAFEITPALSLSTQADDNAFNDVAGNEVDETSVLVKPSFTAVADSGVTLYTIEYSLENASSDAPGSNDYTDQSLSAEVSWQANIRNRFDLKSTMNYGHQERSVDNLTGTNVSELNQFTDKGLSAKYVFGSEGARGRLALELEKNSLRYKTNLAFTDILESDTEKRNLDFSIALSPVSQVIFQVTQTENTFRNITSNNRTDLSVLLGFAWEVSGVVRGDIRFGRSNNKLLNTVVDSSSSVGAAEIKWTPYEYASFTFSANKSAQNTENNVGTFINSEEFAWGWRHQWSDLVSTNLTFVDQTSEFVGANRQDEMSTSTLGLNYALRRWLILASSISLEKSQSNDNSVNYDKTIFGLSLNASL